MLYVMVAFLMHLCTCSSSSGSGSSSSSSSSRSNSSNRSSSSGNSSSSSVTRSYGGTFVGQSTDHSYHQDVHDFGIGLPDFAVVFPALVNITRPGRNFGDTEKNHFKDRDSIFPWRPSVSYKILVHNRTLILNLELHTDFISPYLIVKQHLNVSNSRTEPRNRSSSCYKCYYRGTINDVPENTVSVSLC
ncbi:hypothetical protein Ahia01_000065400, partial [Argonauta hians]